MTDDTLLSSTRRETYRRTIVLVSGSTLVLTAMLIGVLALLEASTTGIEERIPWYFVVAGAIFVASILLLETHTGDGRRILVTAVIVTATGFLLLLLSVEGLIFMIRYPEEVLVSQLVLYFVAAGFLATGFGYWTLNHWREFTGG